MVRLLILSFAFFFGMQAIAADCGRFAVVKQPVKYKKQGKAKEKKARKNGKICQGDTIITGENGRAKIVMADKNEINISPNSEMIIETYEKGKKAVLNVLNGKVRSDVKNKYRDSKSSHYRVKTKSAVAGVRGTEFLTSYNAVTNQSRVVTFEGEVAVGKMVGGNFVSRVIVKPGQFTSNTTKTEPHPAKEVPPAELAQIDRESKVAAPDTSKTPASTPNQNSEDKNDNRDDKGDNRTEPEKNPAPANDDSNADGSADASAPAPGDTSLLDGEGGSGDSDGVLTNPEGERDIASIDGSDSTTTDSGATRDVAQIDLDSALPEPSLELEPEGGALPDFTPPPTLTPDQLIPTDPTQDLCGTSCNDAVINQKVKVIIVPRLPGQ